MGGNVLGMSQREWKGGGEVWEIVVEEERERGPTQPIYFLKAQDVFYRVVYRV